MWSYSKRIVEQAHRSGLSTYQSTPNAFDSSCAFLNSAFASALSGTSGALFYQMVVQAAVGYPHAKKHLTAVQNENFMIVVESFSVTTIRRCANSVGWVSVAALVIIHFTKGF